MSIGFKLAANKRDYQWFCIDKKQCATHAQLNMF